MRPSELKVRTPPHTKQPGWYVGFESRVTQVPSEADGPTPGAVAAALLGAWGAAGRR